jgi:hypothetical protein
MVDEEVCRASLAKRMEIYRVVQFRYKRQSGKHTKIVDTALLKGGQGADCYSSVRSVPSGCCVCSPTIGRRHCRNDSPRCNITPGVRFVNCGPIENSQGQ